MHTYGRGTGETSRVKCFWLPGIKLDRLSGKINSHIKFFEMCPIKL